MQKRNLIIITDPIFPDYIGSVFLENYSKMLYNI